MQAAGRNFETVDELVSAILNQLDLCRALSKARLKDYKRASSQQQENFNVEDLEEIFETVSELNEWIVNK